MPPEAVLLGVTNEPMPHGCDDDKVPRTTRETTSEYSISLGIGRREEEKVTVAPVNNIERRAAKKLVASEGINYTEALRRIRNSGTAPSAVINGQSVTAGSAVEQTVIKAMNAMTNLGGSIMKNNQIDYKALLSELLESGTHPTLGANINIVMSKGTPTGQAKAVNALIRVLAHWESEQKFKEVDINHVCKEANASIISSWSLGNLLEELDTTTLLDGNPIDMSAEKDWTELSSRVEAAIREVPDFGAEGSSVRIISRGMAVLGLASLHGVKRGKWLMIRTGWQAKVTAEQKEQIEKYGQEFVMWAGTADNAEAIIRAAEATRSLDPEVLKLHV